MLYLLMVRTQQGREDRAWLPEAGKDEEDVASPRSAERSRDKLSSTTVLTTPWPPLKKEHL